MRSTIISVASVALTAVQLAQAQTFTSCNPTTNSSCPTDPALGKTITVDFTQGSSDAFTLADGTNITYGDNGAEFVINTETDAPTITSNDYIFFGNVEVVTQAANGTGIVSSFVMESDDLDEIDWEWLGGNTTTVESNYFGKGNTTTYNRAIYHPVSDPQGGFHTYTIDWTSARIQWIIDGTVQRTLEYADALGGQNYPQTPMRVKMGNWDGGSSTASQGTVEWAGGYTDFAYAPFTMYVKSVKITDYSTGASEYTYGDETGSWESINISNGTSSDSSSSSSSSATSSGSASSTKSGSSGTASATGSATTTATSGASSATATATGSSTASKTSSGSESSATGSATSSSGFTQTTGTSVSGAVSVKPSRYGTADFVVVALGLVLGYLVM